MLLLNIRMLHTLYNSSTSSCPMNSILDPLATENFCVKFCTYMTHFLESCYVLVTSKNSVSKYDKFHFQMSNLELASCGWLPLWLHHKKTLPSRDKLSFSEHHVNVENHIIAQYVCQGIVLIQSDNLLISCHNIVTCRTYTWWTFTTIPTGKPKCTTPLDPCIFWNSIL